MFEAQAMSARSPGISMAASSSPTFSVARARAEMLGHHTGQVVAIELELLGDPAVAIDLMDSLLVDLVGQRAHLDGAKSLGWLPERFVEGGEGIQREGRRSPATVSESERKALSLTMTVP